MLPASKTTVAHNDCVFFDLMSGALKGVMRVGVLAKGLLLHERLDVDLVVLCHGKNNYFLSTSFVVLSIVCVHNNKHSLLIQCQSLLIQFQILLIQFKFFKLPGRAPEKSSRGSHLAVRTTKILKFFCMQGKGQPMQNYDCVF